MVCAVLEYALDTAILCCAVTAASAVATAVAAAAAVAFVVFVYQVFVFVDLKTTLINNYGKFFRS